MNNVLEMKGKRFVQADKPKGSGGASMNGSKVVTSNHLEKIKESLIHVKQFWDNEMNLFDGVLVSVHYNKIVAKSNRISGLFKGDKSNNAIVGAKFNKQRTKHIITYFLDDKDLEKSIKLLSEANEILCSLFKGTINKNLFEDKSVIFKQKFDNLSMKMSKFKQVIADASYIDDFKVEKPEMEIKQSIITLYDVNKDITTLFREIGIDILGSRILDNQTVYLDEKQANKLYLKAPYLVSMSTVDMKNMVPGDFIKEYQNGMMSIPNPSIEPTIGVIDTLFDKGVYFSEWVEYHEMVDNNIPKTDYDYRHGTAVSSIIVDGPNLNPWLNDGC